jgi:hypothetical protein
MAKIDPGAEERRAMARRWGVRMMLLSSVIGAVMAIFTLNIGAHLHGPLFMSRRYSGLDGAVRGVVDTVLVACAGALVFGRLGWLLGSVADRRIWKAPVAVGRLGMIDLILFLPVLVAWLYLIDVSW